VKKKVEEDESGRGTMGILPHSNATAF